MWPRRDSNPQPIGYEPTALTIELQGRNSAPNWNRTSNLRFRRALLYPVELWERYIWKEVWESNPCSSNIYGTQIISLSVLPITLTSLFKFGIEGGTRTLTPSLATDFKSVVSAIPPLRH